MTFAARPLVGLAAGSSDPNVQPLGTMNLGGTSIASSGLSVGMTLEANGTIAWLNEMNATQTTPSTTHWYAPTTGGVGNNYRVRFTLQSGTAWSGGLVSGTLYSLTSVRQIFWTLAPEGTISAQVLVEITSSGDTVVLGSGTLTVYAIDEF